MVADQPDECGSGDSDSSCADVALVEVPKVVGLKLKDARLRLSHFTLDIRTRDGSPALAASKVVEQDPRRGKLFESEIVKLIVGGSDL